MEFAIIFIAGVFIGCVVSAIMARRNNVGTLQVCKYDDGTNEPYLFLELHSDTTNLYNKQYVTMKVKNISPK